MTCPGHDHRRHDAEELFQSRRDGSRKKIIIHAAFCIAVLADTPFTSSIPTGIEKRPTFTPNDTRGILTRDLVRSPYDLLGDLP